MSPTKVNVAALIVLGMTIIAVIAWEQEQGRRYERTAGTVRLLTRQLDSLQAANARLRGRLAAITSQAEDQRREVARLRAQIAQLPNERLHPNMERAHFHRFGLSDAHEAKHSQEKERRIPRPDCP